MRQTGAGPNCAAVLPDLISLRELLKSYKPKPAAHSKDSLITGALLVSGVTSAALQA